MERKEKKENWYDRFRSFCMSRMIPSKELEEDGLIYWRAYILFSILFAVFVSGLVTLIPAFVLVIKNNLWGLGIFDLGAWFIVIMLMLSRNISFYIRSALVLILTYLLGLVIIVNVGILSGGPLCLFGFAVFAGIFRGKKAVVLALAVNAITLSIISLLFYTGRFGQTFPFFKTPEAMLASLTTFMLLNIAVAISVRVLVKGLAETIRKQKELLIDLKIEKARLEKIKIKLESEVEEHRQSEMALRASEERYRDLVENATDLICTHDLKGTLLSVNAAAAKDIGLAPEKVVGLCIPDMLPQDRRHEFEDYIRIILRDGMAAGIMKVVTKNGEVRFWEYRNTLRMEGVMEPLVRGMARDVTGEILAKRALKKSEKRYRMLFERNLAGVYRSTVDGRLLDCNDAYAKIFGYDSRDEAVQHPIVDFHVSPRARQDIIAELKIKGVLIDFESQGRRKDGSLIWLLENATLVPGKENESAEIEGMLLDITERKRTEEALLESEEIFRQFMDHSPIYVFFKDANIRAIRLSRNYEKMLGRPIDELLGKNMFDLFPSDLAKSMVADDMRILKEGKPINIEEELNGRFYSTIKFPIFLEGESRYLAGFTIDITERKRMEEEILKADKLESVGILAGGIAHDFNNILTSIIGNISVARMQVKPGQKIFDLLSAAETASIRAQGLTRQLLTFAKGGAPVKEIASIQRLIKESSLFVLQGSKSICEFMIAEDLWPIDADVGQISQVISNIAINANQAMPEGGTIQITAENLILEKTDQLFVKPGRYIRISIKDQGVGIAEKHLSKIFDPYFTTKKEGSGLGLAAAYSIIKKHNGHISVDSLLGYGTTFHIYLPSSDKEIPVKEEAALITGRGKILVMDDDKILREMAEDMLHMLGYEAEFAKDGAEAIEIYKKAIESEKPFDAVILDLTIPGGMGGKEAVKKMLELNSELRAIVFSGYSNDPVMSNYRDYGFKGMMTKPFNFMTLSKVLNEVLNAENRYSMYE